MYQPQQLTVPHQAEGSDLLHVTTNMKATKAMKKEEKKRKRTMTGILSASIRLFLQNT